MTDGEMIFRQMCHTFDKDGNTVAPAKNYATLTPEEKITYLEWRDETSSEEYREDVNRLESQLWPLRPHSDKRFRDQCMTFYDGCNCKPDHTQVDWNDLNIKYRDLLEENDQLKREIDRLERGLC